MKITEIKIKLVARQGDKLLAFASVTFGKCFVVRDIKIIQGERGIFVAMPSRKITDHCPICRAKNHLQANHCNYCGVRLGANRSKTDARGRAILHADIAHPINSRYRRELQEAILAAHQKELERSKQPGYAPVSFGDDAGPEGVDLDYELEETGAPGGGLQVLPLKDDRAQDLSSKVIRPDRPPPPAESSDQGGFGIFGAPPADPAP